MKVRMFVLFAVLFGFSSLAQGQDTDKRLYFVQLAFGQDGSGGMWKVVFSSLNTTVTTHTHTVNTHLYQETKRQMGPTSYQMTNVSPATAWRVMYEDMTANPEDYFTEGGFLSTGIGWTSTLPSGVQRVKSLEAPSSPLLVGFAETIQDDENENVLASATLQYWKEGIKVAEVGEPAVPACLNNVLPVFVANQDMQQTGIAIANPDDFNPVTVRVNLYSALGNNLRGEGLSKTITLPGKGHVSIFVPELFQEIAQNSWFQQTGTLSGQLRVTAPSPVPVLALRTSVVQGVFTMSTLPAKCQ